MLLVLAVSCRNNAYAILPYPPFIEHDNAGPSGILSGGNGTSYNPYLITSADDFEELSNLVNSGTLTETYDFKLLQDITISEQWKSKIIPPSGFSCNISSIASFKFTKKKEFRTPQPRKSRIPVFSGKRKKIDEFYSPQLKKVKNKEMDIYSQKNRKHDNELYSSKYMNKIILSILNVFLSKFWYVRLLIYYLDI